MKQSERGPRSQYARYAYGYSDEKPGKSFWVILAVMALFCISQIVTLNDPYHDDTSSKSQMNEPAARPLP